MMDDERWKMTDARFDMTIAIVGGLLLGILCLLVLWG
jgi:hypothetical protein